MFTASCLQEYEEKLARLQADYNAEQQSRAKLQEDIAVLRSEYRSKMSEKVPTSRGSSVLKDVGKLSSKDQRKFPAVPPLHVQTAKQPKHTFSSYNC